MYFPIFTGSALLHLLAAHPRIVALFGIAGTVSLLFAPHGPGNYRGTATYLERLDAQIGETAPIASEYRIRAERAVDAMIANGRHEDIESAVDRALRACGPGCTDLATPLVMGNKELLKRVLVISDLDRRVEAARNVAAGSAPAVNP
jgi:hypothetical protein